MTHTKSIRGVIPFLLHLAPAVARHMPWDHNSAGGRVPTAHGPSHSTDSRGLDFWTLQFQQHLSTCGESWCTTVLPCVDLAASRRSPLSHHLSPAGPVSWKLRARILGSSKVGKLGSLLASLVDAFHAHKIASAIDVTSTFHQSISVQIFQGLPKPRIGCWRCTIQSQTSRFVDAA